MAPERHDAGARQRGQVPFGSRIDIRFPSLRSLATGCAGDGASAKVGLWA
jgi:hypothetical protein